MSDHSPIDTIVAISTPPGVGGIGIVRLSGPRALAIALQIFKPRKAIRRIAPGRVVLGDLGDPGKAKFDEAFLVYFKAPDSYTREDVVELSCHGSPAVLSEVVKLAVRAGARRAEAGEFTRRAYLSGRIDILQAEAVQSLIDSDSLDVARVAFGQLEGGLSARIADIRARTVRLLAEIEARVEFPDEDLRIPDGRIAREIRAMLSSVRELTSSHEAGKLMTEGFDLAIAGRPNVGKSTLFNSLAGKDRAIVTPYPGTTRDLLRERVRFGEAVFQLTDMAGLGKTSHPADKEGVKRGRAVAGKADGVLFVFDRSRPETREDLELLRELGSAKGLVVFNKSDLPARIDEDRIRRAAGPMPSVEVSALDGSGIEELKRTIRKRFAPSRRRWNEIILHSRQRTILAQIGDCLDSALALMRDGCGDEICAEEVRKAIPLLGRLTGEIRSEEVLREIFDRFCVGK